MGAFDKFRKLRERTADVAKSLEQERQDPKRKAGWSDDRGGGEGDVDLAKTLLRTHYAPSPELSEWQRASDDLHIAKTLMRAACAARNESDAGIDDELLRTPLGLRQAMASVDLQKAMDTATIAEGLEFIPDEMSSQFVDVLRLPLKVAQQHEHFTMPRSPWTLPVAAADIVGRLIPERLTDGLFTATQLVPAITPGTGQQQFVAQTLGAMIVISKELTMESIVPVVQFARSRLTVAIGRAIETGTINGVRAGAHMDADTNADANLATRAERAWDGYRQLCINNTIRIDAGNAELSTKFLRRLRDQLGIYGVDPTGIYYLVGTTGHSQMLNLDELLTVDKFGPNATVATGVVGKFDGSDVVVSEHQRQDLNAAGVDQIGGVADRTLVHCINKQSMQFGDRQSLQWQLVDAPFTRQKVAMLDMMLDFRTVLDAPAATTFIAEGFNVAT